MKKTRIDVRGVIVPSDYDASWFSSYIERGILTPESRFRKQLADAKDGAEIYINSPGGSVFAGNEMINAVKAAARDGREVEIVIGAMAASMAAAMVVQAGVPVRAHKNSKLMFHGAQALTIGGASAHADEAKLLADINDDLKTALVAKGADAAAVEEWFAEGREGWLTADEALAAGLVSEIIDAEDATKPAILRMEDVTDLERYDLKIAACAGIEIEQPISEAAGGNVENTPGAAPSPEPKQESPAASEPIPEQLPEAAALFDAIEALKAQIEAQKAEHAAELRKLQSAKDREIAELREAAKVAADALALAEEQHKTHLAERDARLAEASAGLEKAQADTKALNDRLMRLTAAAITPSPELEPSNWAEAMALCGGDHAKAVARFQDLHKRIIAKANPNQKKG